MDSARKRYLKKGTESNELRYKALKREYNYDIRRAKQNYFGEQLFKAQKDSKKLWKVINSIIHGKAKSDPVESLIVNDCLISDSQQISEIFSDYYKYSAVNKIGEVKDNNDFEQFLAAKDMRKDTFSLQDVTLEEVWKVIKEISPKSSSGIDKIPARLVCKTANSLLLPLKLIINKIFKSGKFPDQLKTSKITPVLKKGLFMLQNFRPICQQSVFSKVIEKCVQKQMVQHDKIHYDQKYQFAFRNKHSTLEPILITRHEIEQHLAMNRYVLIIMIDLSIAFETVCVKKILPKKIQFYGGSENTVNFFKSFFNNRKHVVDWKGTKSKENELFGVSICQGSTLGPICFNKYLGCYDNVVNGDWVDGNEHVGACDESKKPSFCKGVYFADDINKIVASECLDELFKRGNLELAKTGTYMDANQLIINENKTQYLLFKPKGKNNIMINNSLKLKGKEIQQVDSARYLGVILDNKLNFDEHFQKVKLKLKDAVKALICTRRSLNYHAKKLLYDGFFKPHIEYCCIAFLDKWSKSKINELFTLQKQALRLIFDAKRNVHTGKLFELAKILPITKLYETECTKLVFKNKFDPSYMDQPLAVRELINFPDSNIDRLYADKNRIKIPNHYKNGHCFYNILNSWNNSDNDYKMAGNLYSLKKMIKEDITNSHPPCTIKNCHICDLDKGRCYQRYMSR